IRKLGDKALKDIFATLKRDRFGRHNIERRGAGGDPTDEAKRYEFGDPFLLDLKKTLMNAVERNGAGTPVRLSPDDCEVIRTELSRRLLGRQKGGNKQIMMITDGEPTAHMEGGEADFSYPPTRRTFEETLKEVQRCTREGITINTFMLEQSRMLTQFIEQLARI